MVEKVYPQSVSMVWALGVIFGAARMPRTLVMPLLSWIFSTYLLSCVTAERSAL